MWPAAESQPAMIRFVDPVGEHHALVDLPNAYQVTALMIRVGSAPTHDNPTRACYEADEEVAEALNPAPSRRRHPSASCQGPDHSLPRSGAGTQPWFLAENDVDPEPNDNRGRTPMD